MFVIYLLLLIVAAICFGVAAFVATRPDAAASRVNLVALGLLAWVLVPLIHAMVALANR